MSEVSGNEIGRRATRPFRVRFEALARAAALGLGALALGALAACDDAPAARSWPPGTLVAVDDLPITAAEIARDIAAVMVAEPHWGEAQLQRLALNEISLPRAIIRVESGETARAEARRSIDLQYERIASGQQLGPPTAAGALGREVFGFWKELGLLQWGAALELAPGEWSEVLEAPGRFVRVRLLERVEGPVPAATKLRLDTIEAPYSELRGWPVNADDLLKRHHLTIVDPAWDAVVPELTKYKMGAHQP